MPDNIQLFGENMFGVHSIEYDGLTSFFYVFAGLRDGEQWLGWDELCGLARDLDIPTVPLLNRQTVGQHFNVLLVSGSILHSSALV
jgi:hypothetical protein